MSKISPVVLGALIAVLSLFAETYRLSQYPIHWDERFYLHHAGSFKPIVIDRDWNNPFATSPMHYNGTPLGIGIMGGLIYFSQYRHILREPSLGSSSIFVPSKDLSVQPFPEAEKYILILRGKLLIFRALSNVGLFAVGCLAGAAVPGAAAALYLLFNWQFLQITGMAMLDGIWLFLHLLGILSIYLYMRCVQRRRASLLVRATLSTLVGTTIGLLAATKIHGAANLIVFFICWLALVLKNWRSGELGRDGVAAACLDMSIVGALSALTFIAVIPVLHADPLYGMAEMYKRRLLLEGNQISRTPQLYIPGPLQRLEYARDVVGLGWAKSFLLLAGFLIFLTRSFDSLRKKDVAVGMHLLVVAAFLVYAGIIMSFMRLGQARYVLVLFPYSYLFITQAALNLLERSRGLLAAPRFHQGPIARLASFYRVADWWHLSGLGALGYLAATNSLRLTPDAALCLLISVLSLAYGYSFNTLGDAPESSSPRRIAAALLPAALLVIIVAVYCRYFLWVILAAMALNTLYSLPPVALKRFPFVSVFANACVFGALCLLGTTISSRSLQNRDMVLMSVYLAGFFLPAQLIHELAHAGQDDRLDHFRRYSRGYLAGIAFAILALAAFSLYLMDASRLNASFLATNLLWLYFLAILWRSGIWDEFRPETALRLRGRLRQISMALGVVLICAFTVCR